MHEWTWSWDVIADADDDDDDADDRGDLLNAAADMTESEWLTNWIKMHSHSYIGIHTEKPWTTG